MMAIHVLCKKCTSTVGPLEVTRTVGTELVGTMTNKERIEAQTGLTDMDVGGEVGL